MRRLMQTTIALPSIALSRSSKMRHQVVSDQVDALFGAHQRLQLRPAVLELLFLLDLLALGGLFEVPVQLGALRFVQRQLRQPALVVDRHGPRRRALPGGCRRC